MKKSLKIISFLMILLMLTSNLSVTANAEVLKQHKYKGFVYEFQGKKKIYINKYTGKKKTITIPKKIKGNKVIGISTHSLKNVTTLHIPNDFQINVAGPNNIKKITVKKSNKKYSVKNNLLLNKKGDTLLSCPGGINNPKIPDSVTKIAFASFGGDIKTVRLGKNVTSIELWAFSDCDKLKKVVCNDKLTDIGDGAFINCTSLKNISLPEGLEKIGDDAFENCTSLKKIIIPSTVKSIGGAAFADCNSLKSIYIYSKNCEIKRGILYNAIPKSTTIYGYKDSTAEKYANKYGNKFVEIKE